VNEFKGNPNPPEENLKSLLFKFCLQSPAPNLKTKIGNYFVLGIAYFAGAFHWAWFIYFGNVRERFIDWQKFLDYYEVIQKALLETSIPYFMPHFYKGTNQFLALPETDLSPTIVLLSFLSVEDFFLTQCLVVYSLGFLGCLWLKKKYRWSLITFTVFFLIFNFNGHITSHLAVGHWPWISYFLFPYFIGWVLSLVEGNLSVSHGCNLAFVLFGILLLGGLHPFVWCLIFLLLLCLFQKRYWKPITIGVGLALIFSSYRIIPATITFWGYQNQFFFGFPSVEVFWAALTEISQSPLVILDKKFTENSILPLWELDHYITILGLGIILYFGIWRRWRETGTEGGYKVLNIPMLIITIFSLGSIFGWMTYLPIPFITVERVSSRFLILPILILTVLSCIWMQRMFNRLQPGWGAQILVIAGILYEGVFLMMHSSAWHEKTLYMEAAMGTLPWTDPPSEWAQSVESYYVSIVQVSYLISLTALLAFAIGTFYFKFGRQASEEWGQA